MKINPSSKIIQTTLGLSINPAQDVFKIEGNVLYQESAQAWNTIKIKRELLFLYPQLRDKRSPAKYTMLVPRSGEETKKQVEAFIRQNKIPILLFLEKEEIEGN